MAICCSAAAGGSLARTTPVTKVAAITANMAISGINLLLCIFRFSVSSWSAGGQTGVGYRQRTLHVHVLDLTQAQVARELSCRHRERARGGRRARLRLGIGGAAGRVEGHVAFDLLLDLVDVAVQHRH